MGEGDDSRNLRLSVFRGNPCGSDGFRGGRNDTDATDDFLEPVVGRSLPLCEVRRESSGISLLANDMDVVLAAVDAPSSGDWVSGFKTLIFAGTEADGRAAELLPADPAEK